MMGQITTDFVIFAIMAIANGILACLFVVTLAWTILAFINKEEKGYKIFNIFVNIIILFLWSAVCFIMTDNNSKSVIAFIKILIKKYFG